MKSNEIVDLSKTPLLMLCKQIPLYIVPVVNNTKKSTLWNHRNVINSFIALKKKLKPAMEIKT